MATSAVLSMAAPSPFSVVCQLPMLSYASSAKPGGLTTGAWQPTHGAARGLRGRPCSRLVLPVVGQRRGRRAVRWRADLPAQHLLLDEGATQNRRRPVVRASTTRRKPACVNTPARCVGLEVRHRQVRAVAGGAETVDGREVLVDEGDRLGHQVLERSLEVERDVVEELLRLVRQRRDHRRLERREQRRIVRRLGPARGVALQRVRPGGTRPPSRAPSGPSASAAPASGCPAPASSAVRPGRPLNSMSSGIVPHSM